jgi:hypothetical protein
VADAFTSSPSEGRIGGTTGLWRNTEPEAVALLTEAAETDLPSADTAPIVTSARTLWEAYDDIFVFDLEGADDPAGRTRAATCGVKLWGDETTSNQPTLATA